MRPWRALPVTRHGNEIIPSCKRTAALGLFAASAKSCHARLWIRHKATSGQRQSQYIRHHTVWMTLGNIHTGLCSTMELNHPERLRPFRLIQRRSGSNMLIVACRFSTPVCYCRGQP